MENENVKIPNRSAEDFMMAFANSFEKNVQSATENISEETIEETDDFLPYGSQEDTDYSEEPVHIDEAEEYYEEEAEQDEPAESESAIEPEPTEKQLRKTEKQAAKDAKWEKKQAKRNAKIDRQQRNNTKVMLGGAIFLGIICIFLLVMNHFKLSFTDIPDVLSGEKDLSVTTTTMPLAISEPSESGPTAPPKGNYIVTAEDGVYLRESASSSAGRVAVLEKGSKITVSAFRYDNENECFWGRTGLNGNYGWVMLTALTMDDAPTESTETTAESLG
ncbi:MAG: SH3 domain-containing protein [Ruminococcaceae bacterium]|nr:SH3 domain-containing protein [Oscillospiraceae bacterium]